MIRQKKNSGIFAAVALAIFFFATPAKPMLLRGSVPPVVTIDLALNLGAGGYITGMSISSDNTQVIRTDTYGGYVWNPSATSPVGNSTAYPGFTGGAWQQLLTSSSAPSACTSSGQQLYNGGFYELVISPSNSNYLFAVYWACNGSTDTQIYFSQNKGQTWTATSWQSTAGHFSYFNVISPNAVNRGWGPRMAIDPSTCGTSTTCTVYAGMGIAGMWKSVNSGATWTLLSNLPASTTDDPGITAVAIDPVTTSTIYASSAGNGVYQSTNSGANWTLLTSGTGPGAGGAPFGVVSGNHSYFVCDSSQALWVWTTTWTKKISGGNDQQNCRGIAVNPATNTWIRVISTFGNLAESTDGGSTWTAFTGNNAAPTITANDIPWQQPIGDGGTKYGLIWDAATPAAGKMLTNTSRGVWAAIQTTGIVVTTPATVYSQSIGIEQLNVTRILVPPSAGGLPIACSWDSMILNVPSASPGGSFPGTSPGIQPTTALSACWDVDYIQASPATQFVVTGDGFYGGNSNGYLYNCTIGSSCASIPLPPNAFPTNTQSGSNIAAADSNHMVFAGSEVAPYFTANGGSSWTQATFAGSPSFSGLNLQQFITAHPTKALCADKVASGTYYLSLPGAGLYFTTNGTAWSLANSISAVEQGPGSTMFCTPPLGAGSTVAAGDIWIAGGGAGAQGTAPAGNALWHITGANTASPTIKTCTGTSSTWAVGFGAPKSGNTYPSVYMAGWLNGTYGIYRSDDNNCASWTLIDTWPNGVIDIVWSITGDPTSWNKVYYGFSGNGAVAKQY